MTKQEAIAFSISTGQPITHHLFSNDEYVIVDNENKCLCDEKGYQLPYDEFWAIRTGGAWEDGWDVYQPSMPLPLLYFPFDMDGVIKCDCRETYDTLSPKEFGIKKFNKTKKKH